MKNIDCGDTVSILNYGLSSQNKIADLNKTVSAIIRQKDYHDLLECFEEIFSIAENTDIAQLAEKEQRVEELRTDLVKYRMELLKESKLLQGLRETNNLYVRQLDEEIQDAEGWLQEKKLSKQPDGRHRTELLKKRLYELKTSRTVGESFSTQIRLSEENSIELADRIQNILAHILPLLRGRISAETDKMSFAQIRKLLREDVGEMGKICREQDKISNTGSVFFDAFLEKLDRLLPG